MNEHAIIEAGPGAFGDGSHPTTAGVLTALEALDPADFAPAQALDVGSGSGILAMAIHGRFGCPVLATELDREAFDTLQQNIAANGYDGHITPLRSDGFAHPAIAAAAPFDLMVINILAEPLLAMAADAVAHLAEEGVLILSGMLAWQEPQIREAYQSLGLELAARLTAKEWITLAFRK